MKKVLFYIILVFTISIFAILIFNIEKTDEGVVGNFKQCLEAGNTVMESYPRQCLSKGGQVFVEDIGNELEKMYLITIDSPRPNQKITSPLTISGQARGYWFFEGDFPVFLYDGDDNLIITSFATALSDWMTEDMVGFTAELSFDLPETKEGYLILQKDNPSDLPENNNQLKVPVNF